MVSSWMDGQMHSGRHVELAGISQYIYIYIILYYIILYYIILYYFIYYIILYYIILYYIILYYIILYYIILYYIILYYIYIHIWTLGKSKILVEDDKHHSYIMIHHCTSH